jgi:hypothetical protein
MVDIIDWYNANDSAILNNLCFRSNLSPTGEKKRGGVLDTENAPSCGHPSMICSSDKSRRDDMILEVMPYF